MVPHPRPIRQQSQLVRLTHIQDYKRRPPLNPTPNGSIVDTRVPFPFARAADARYGAPGDQRTGKSPGRQQEEHENRKGRA
jgi:hypothetical protein